MKAGPKKVNESVLVKRRLERFIAKIKQVGECAVWTGPRNRTNAPIVRDPWTDNPTTAARIVYRMHCGKIPLEDDSRVVVRCPHNTEYCLNIEHLELVPTKADKKVELFA